MRRITLIVLALMVCSIASAVPINPTVDWYTSHPTCRHYNTAYNPATGHLVTNNRYFSGTEQAAGWTPGLHIWSSADGSLLSAKETPTKFAPGSSPFSLTCTTDGVLYGADLSLGEVVSKFADETTTAVLMPAPDLDFSRQCNVRGTSSTPTLYMANGSSDLDKAQVLQLDATLTTWSVVSTIPAPFTKSMVCVKDRDTLLGGGPWQDDGDTSPVMGFPDLYRNLNAGSWAYANWVRDDTFNPEDATTGGWSYSLGGDYADGLFWVLLYWDAKIVAYDALYGNILAQIPVDTWGYLSWGKPAILYYGSLMTEEGGAPADTVFWGSRLYNADANGALGKLTYTAPKPVINEVVYDDAGTDDEEFIEIYGVPGTDISGYTIDGHTASDGSVYATWTIPAATTIPADGFYVIGMAGVPNVDQVTATTIQNGTPDAIVLKDAGSVIIDALGYEMTNTPGSLPASSYEGTGYHGGPNWGCELSLGRKIDGKDTDDNQDDFAVLIKTPGAPNVGSLYVDDMPYVDRMPAAGPELAWVGSFVDPTTLDPASVGAPDSPEAGTVGALAASPDSVGRVDDPAGGGHVAVIGDHNITGRNVNLQAYAYIGVDSESLGLFVRGIGDSAWHSTSSLYEECYAIEYFDDGTTSVVRVMKELGEDGSRTVFASDYSIAAEGWHHLRIWANGTTVAGYLDQVKLVEVTDSDIATGLVGFGFREIHTGAPINGMLVDSVIIDDNFTDTSTEVADWNLF
jgi:hypothetical protein